MSALVSTGVVDVEVPAVAVPAMRPERPPDTAAARPARPRRSVALVFCVALAHDQWVRRRTRLDHKTRGRWIGAGPGSVRAATAFARSVP